MLAAHRRLAVVSLLLVAPFASAADVETPPAEPTPAIPVPATEAPPAPPEPSFIDWNLIGDVQGDGMIATSARSEHVRRFELRRARLGFVADLFFDWRLRVSEDFGRYNGLRDLTAEYRGWPVWLSAGRMIEPFGLLQGGASSAVFMERPQPVAIGPGYGLGAQANYAGDDWGLTVGRFGATQNDLELGGRKEKATSGRLTWAPVNRDSMTVHVGIDGSRRRSGLGLQQFDALPETTLLTDYDTQSLASSYDNPEPGSSGSDQYWMYAGELAGHVGPLMLETEYLGTVFDGVNTRNPSTGKLEPIPSPKYHGYYVQASYALTGEHRDYSVRHGVFGAIFPAAPLQAGGVGAVEVCARYSYTDLRYTVRYHGDTGDLGEIGSLGANWYPTDSIKLMLDFLQIKRLPAGPVDVFGQRANVRRLDWVVQSRLQWYFVAP